MSHSYSPLTRLLYVFAREEHRLFSKNAVPHPTTEVTANETLAPTTMAQANAALGHIDAVVLENRQDLRSSVAELRQTVLTASSVVDQLDRTLSYNADNIDQTLENVRVITQHLKDLTETLKRRPYTLIRADRPRERKPGEK